MPDHDDRGADDLDERGAGGPGEVLVELVRDGAADVVRLEALPARPGELGRMSWPTTIIGAPTTSTNAEPVANARSSSSWSGTVPRTSYALKMAPTLAAPSVDVVGVWGMARSLDVTPPRPARRLVSRW